MNLIKFRKWLSRIVSCLLFVSLIIMLYSVISSKLIGKEPQVFGYQLKTVLSGSMEPDIKTGSVIAIKPVKNKMDFAEGNVVTFISKDDHSKLITHRIHEVIGDKTNPVYITKGDNNEVPDSDPVIPQNIVGEYHGFTIPYIGFLMQFATSKLGNVLLLILPGVAILLYSLITMWKALADYEKEKNNKVVGN
ncbi:signal peptidase I SipW [Neobacillus niacini]|uniref:signal peptidase I SipW n=1 Tax=Neobacillus niacini TaxID=86668 RepID=UPI003983C7EE